MHLLQIYYPDPCLASFPGSSPAVCDKKLGRSLGTRLIRAYCVNLFIKQVVSVTCLCSKFLTGVTVSLANSSLSVSESSSGTTVSLCVSLDGAPGPIDRDIEVTLNTVPGTAG